MTRRSVGFTIVVVVAGLLGGCGGGDGGGGSSSSPPPRTAPDLAGVWAGHWQGADPALGPVTGFWQATVAQSANGTGVSGTGFLIGDVDCMDGVLSGSAGQTTFTGTVDRRPCSLNTWELTALSTVEESAAGSWTQKETKAQGTFVGTRIAVPGGPRGAAAAGKLALVGGTIHPVSAPPIADGTLVLDGASIVAVGQDVAIPPDARVQNISGLHVYPALLDANTVLGLVEVSSVPGTVDVSEMGDINPNVRAEVAINPESDLLPVTMANCRQVAISKS